ncbi:MAG TPA: Flp family type IVb pilin [Coleofasciculaceae cyanobacterium]|jgi:Flp pilus assembly pilin Flp
MKIMSVGNLKKELSARNRQQGVTIPEYALIGLGVVIAAITAITLLGGTVSQSFANLGNAFSANASNSPTALAGTPTGGGGGTADPSAPTAPTTGAGGIGSISLTTADGVQITLDGFPQNIKDAVQSTGTNGTTFLTANQLTTLTSQLQDAGAVDSAQAGMLADLANQGHRMAEIQQAIESALASGATPDTAITIGDQTQSIESWADGLSATTCTGAPTCGVQVNSLNDLLAQASQSGALDDPTVRFLVEALTADIVYLSEPYDDALDNYTTYDNLQVKAVDTVVNSDAEGICTTGKGKDNGVKCT